MMKPANRADAGEQKRWQMRPNLRWLAIAARPGSRRALIGIYKCLILGANLPLSDFRDRLLHACTGPRYKFRRKRGVRHSRESISLRETAKVHAAKARH